MLIDSPCLASHSETIFLKIIPWERAWERKPAALSQALGLRSHPSRRLQPNCVLEQLIDRVEQGLQNRFDQVQFKTIKQTGDGAEQIAEQVPWTRHGTDI